MSQFSARNWFGLRCWLQMCPCMGIHGKVRCVACRRTLFVYGSWLTSKQKA